MRENRPYGSEGGEAKSLPYPYQKTYTRDLAARCVRGLRKTSALKTEGVGNAGRPMHPQPRVRYW
jgi:hypothetical protein